MAHPFGSNETAPMIALTWGRHLAPVVSAMIVDKPTLASRLVLAPRRLLHGLSAYMQYALAARLDTEEIARQIEIEDIRVLLSKAVPNPHPRLYRTLERLGSTVCELPTYRRLNEVLNGPAADLLTGTEEITERHIDIATQIVGDPVLLSARQALNSSYSNLQNLRTALTYLRVTGLANDIEYLPPNAGWKAILRRIKNDLGRATAPKTEFAVPEGWRQIADVADLWRIGAIIGNCLSSLTAGGENYVSELMSGESVFLIRDDDPVMLARISKVGPRLWTLGETATSRAGPDITLVRDVLRADLDDAVAAVGGRMLDDVPLSAIRTIAWRAERGANDDLGDLEDAA